ncbi:MAG: condensation domain-containing protein, partial [Gemmatimonadota bacterium]|nr:condensation domain-containing protein [Gemmatimonadota bacterium]
MSETRDRLANLSPEKRALLVRRLGERRGRERGADDAWPTIVPDPHRRHEPFPLTPLQEAYWIGRDASLAMGRVATHSYMELEGEGLDPKRIEAAWNRLIERHDALRIRVLPDGRQQAAARVERYQIPVEDLSDAGSGARERRLEELRTSMSHAVPDPGSWPLFDLRAARLPEDRLRLFLGVDALIVDAWSVRLLFEEWDTLYRDPEADLPHLDLTLRDYVLGLEELEGTERFERAREHWAARAPELPPPPALPLAVAPESLSETRFVRRTAELDADRWGRIRERAGRAGMTATAVALAAYADVLSLWAERPRFTLSVPQLNRHPLHPQVDRLVGELASFLLLEVDNRGDDGFSERARRHQARLWEDLDHAVFGGVRVLRQMARAAEGGRAPMMPVVFTSAPQQGGQGGVGAALPEGSWRVVHVNNQSSQVWLDNHLSERDGALICDWDTVDAVFPEGMPADMLGSFMRHLERLADDEDWWERSWPDQARELLPRAHVAVIDGANDTAAPVPEERIQDAFFRQVLNRPEAVAVATPERRLGYGELAAEIRSCAEGLRKAGARRGDLVAIVMEKGWEQVVAAFAVLEVGAAYLWIVPISYGAAGIVMVSNAAFNGLGRPLPAVAVSTLR